MKMNLKKVILKLLKICYCSIWIKIINHNNQTEMIRLQGGLPTSFSFLGCSNAFTNADTLHRQWNLTPVEEKKSIFERVTEKR